MAEEDKPKCSCGDPDCNNSGETAEHQHNHDHEHTHEDGVCHEHGEGCACSKFVDHTPLSDEEKLEIEADPAAGSLAGALRGSFFFLKIGMVLLLLLFIKDRFISVDKGQIMLVQRFGKFVTDDKGIRIYEPGTYHFIWPYPIEETKVLNTSEEKELELENDFWPSIKAVDAAEGSSSLSELDELSPERDGYNITGDLYILHSRWKVKYRIDDYRAYLLTSTKPIEILKAICRDAIVSNFAGVSVDYAYFENKPQLFDSINEDVREELKKRDIGIKLISLTNVSLLPPGITQPAFTALTSSLSDRKRLIDDARTQANGIIKSGESEALKIRTDAEQYKVAIVSRTKAEAKRMQDLLARFPNDPKGLDIFLEQFRYDRIRDALKTSRLYILRDGNNIFWTSPSPESLFESEETEPTK